MTFASEFLTMCKDTATRKPVTGRNAYGGQTFGTSVPLTGCRLVRKARMVRNSQGDNVVSSAQLWVMANYAIQADDVIVLSDGTTPTVLSVDRPQDETGNFTHVKVYF